MSVSIGRILCGVDFSECSKRALHHALALARWYGATVSVLYVHRVTPAVFATGPFVGPEILQPISLTAEERARLLGGFRGFVGKENAAGLAVDTEVEEALDVAGTIRARAAAFGADLLVVGTHGRTGFERFVLGSVAEKVLRKPGCPVLAVPPHSDDPGEVSYDRVVCAVDFSPGSARALAYATSVAARARARLTVAHIVELPIDVPDMPQVDWTAYRAARFEQARSAMASMTADARRECQLDELLLAGSARQEILRLVAEQQADLLVMGVHGRGALDLMLFGSVIQDVVRRATCPVLAVGLS